MRITIDGAGRVVIPKGIRDALGLLPGEQLEVRETAGRIEIEPVATRVRLQDSPAGLVAVATEAAELLTTDEVRDLVERLRR